MQLSGLPLHTMQSEDSYEAIPSADRLSTDSITSQQSDNARKLCTITSDPSLPYKVSLNLRHAGTDPITGEESYAVHKVSIRYKPVKRTGNERKAIYDSIATIFGKLSDEFSTQNESVRFTLQDGRSIHLDYPAQPIKGIESGITRPFANNGYVNFPTDTTLQLSFCHKREDGTTYKAPMPMKRSQIHTLVKALMYQLDRSKKAGSPIPN